MNVSTSLKVIRNLRTIIAFAMVAAISITASHTLAADRGAKIDLWLSSDTKGHALVIGNSRYHHISPLTNPANDAADISTALKQLGFEVTLTVDATHRAMENEILRFGRKLRKGGVGLFYFAGHGVQVSGRNYLIPIDANVDSESDIKFETVDAGRVLGKMEDAGNGINIIILDACRNNPFAGKFRAGSKGLAKMEAPTGSILAYSTAPGSVAADGEGRNGLYTSKLLKFINQKGLSIEDCFKKVRIEVMEASEKRQVPWESSSLTANFYFVSPESVNVATNNSRPSESVELLFWESVRDSKDVRQYQSYIDEFPDGTFVKLARIYIDKYGTQPTSVVEKPAKKSEKIQPVAKLTPSHDKDRLRKEKFTSETNKKFKLAFLPSIFERSKWGFYSTKQQYDAVLKVIDKQQSLDLVYAYGNDPASDVSKIWKNKSLFSVSELDVAAVKQYCADMDADIALIMRSSEGTYELELYLVDLKPEKVIYRAKTPIHIYNHFEDIELQVAKALTTIIDAEIKTQSNMIE